MKPTPKTVTAIRTRSVRRRNVTGSNKRIFYQIGLRDLEGYERRLDNRRRTLATANKVIEELRNTMRYAEIWLIEVHPV